MEPAQHVTLHNGEAISKLAILEQTRITLEFQVLGRDGTLLNSGSSIPPGACSRCTASR